MSGKISALIDLTTIGTEDTSVAPVPSQKDEPQSDCVSISDDRWFKDQANASKEGAKLASRDKALAQENGAQSWSLQI